MRTRVRRFAHLLERLGLAMAGAASGLFVAAHVGTSIAALTSQGFILIMMLAGATGFYLGIDTPPQRLPDGARKVDAAELLSALGTFLAALAAFASVAVIVLREDLHVAGTALIMAAWVIGVGMQIVSGTIARMRG
jgi:hypothetical protein